MEKNTFDNNIIVTGTLTYGRLLNKFQRTILICSIIISLMLIFIAFFSLIYLDNLLDGIIFVICSGIFGSILIFTSYLELKYDKKNRDLISQSIPDMVVLEATLEVLQRDWNGSKKIRISFRHKRQRIVLDSNKYIKLNNSLDGKINILYSQNMNSIMFFTYKLKQIRSNV